MRTDHIAALEAIGGIPHEILYDRMKTDVIGEAGGGIACNRALIDFARHCGFQLKACRPYRAKAKGKVERPYRYIREDFFLARSFRNLDDLNVQLQHWLDTVANPRVHATTPCVVNDQPSIRRLRFSVVGPGVSASPEWGSRWPAFCGGLPRGRDRRRVGDSSSPRFGWRRRGGRRSRSAVATTKSPKISANRKSRVSRLGL